jgi:hypothetical protein
MNLLQFLLYAGWLISASSAFSVPSINPRAMAKVRLEFPSFVGPSHHDVATATVPLGLPRRIKQFFGTIGQGRIRRVLRRKISRWIMTAVMWWAIYCVPVVPPAQAHHRVDSRNHFHIARLLEQKDRLREWDLLPYLIDQSIRRRGAMIQIEKYPIQFASSSNPNSGTVAELPTAIQMLLG